MQRTQSEIRTGKPDSEITGKEQFPRFTIIHKEPSRTNIVYEEKINGQIIRKLISMRRL